MKKENAEALVENLINSAMELGSAMQRGNSKADVAHFKGMVDYTEAKLMRRVLDSVPNNGVCWTCMHLTKTGQAIVCAATGNIMTVEFIEQGDESVEFCDKRMNIAEVQRHGDKG